VCLYVSDITYTSCTLELSGGSCRGSLSLKAALSFVRSLFAAVVVVVRRRRRRRCRRSSFVVRSSPSWWRSFFFALAVSVRSLWHSLVRIRIRANVHLRECLLVGFAQ